MEVAMSIFICCFWMANISITLIILSAIQSYVSDLYEHGLDFSMDEVIVFFYRNYDSFILLCFMDCVYTADTRYAVKWID